MAVSVALTTDKTTYNVGDTVVLTYTVNGAPSHTVAFSGTVTVDGVVMPVSAGPVTVAHVQSYAAPTGTGQPTAVQDPSNPAVWRVVAA